MTRVSPTTSPYWWIYKQDGVYTATITRDGKRQSFDGDSLAAARQYAVETAPEFPVRLSPACKREMGKVKS